MDNEMVRVIDGDHARVNVTYGGQSGDLSDPVFFQSPDGDIRAWVTEAVRTGSVPGLPAAPDADFRDYVIDRHPPTEARPHNLIMIRPKTVYGAECAHDWRLFVGAILMVVPSGHVVQSCCKCATLRTTHRAHARD